MRKDFVNKKTYSRIGGIENMKIIKEGKIPTVDEKKFVCSHCECEFIADVYDIHYGEKVKERLLNYTAYVECPTCGKYITW